MTFIGAGLACAVMTLALRIAGPFVIDRFLGLFEDRVHTCGSSCRFRTITRRLCTISAGLAWMLSYSGSPPSKYLAGWVLRVCALAEVPNV